MRGKKKYDINDIKKILPRCVIKGDIFKCFSNAKNIQEADDNSIIWIKLGHINCKDIIENTKAKYIVCGRDITIPVNEQKSKCFVIVENPRLSFAKIINVLFAEKVGAGIDKTAIIHPNAIIGSNVFIGPNTYIGDIEIGDSTIIYGNSYFYNNVKIGKNCVFHAGVIIGADGFGFEKNKKDEWIKFSHIGGVKIEDNVEIGSNSTIDKGTLSNTFIGNGVKIDNQCHIGHNVIIEKNTIITAGVVIGGSTTIGRNCWIAPNVSIINGIDIKENVFIGIGSVVVRNIKENSKIFGNPALNINNH